MMDEYQNDKNEAIEQKVSKMDPAYYMCIKQTRFSRNPRFSTRVEVTARVTKKVKNTWLGSYRKAHRYQFQCGLINCAYE